MYKKLVSLVLVLVMAIAVVGCGADTRKSEKQAKDSSGVEVIKIGDTNVTLDYIYLYTIQYIYTYPADADTIAADMDNYKNQILAQIRSDEIQYQVAKEKGIQLTEEEKAEMEQVVDKYYDTFTEKLLNTYGITKDAVSELFKKQRYLTKLNDTTTVELEEKHKKEMAEEVKDKDFYELYYLLFPTVEYDEENIPKTNDKGANIPLKAEEKEAQKKLAEEAMEKLKAGENPEQLAKDYKISDYSDTIRAFKGAYDEGLENLIANLKDGDVSEIYEDDLGYMVVKMIQTKDDEYKEYYAETYAAQKASEEIEQEKAEWLNSIQVDIEKDLDAEVWDSLDISTVAEKMMKLGIVSKAK